MSGYELDEDIVAQMKAAIDRDSDDEVEEELPGLEEQKHYLMSHIDIVSVKDREEIKDIIVRNKQKHRLQTCSQGLVTDLSSMPADIIKDMYILLAYKINRRNEI